MGIDLHPVTACPDPGLDRFERQPTDFTGTPVACGIPPSLLYAGHWLGLAAFIRSR